ncbi:MAG: Hsp33 family molecular chaperone HslO [Myxococcota bacterium]
MDRILRGLDGNKAIRLVAAITTDVVREGVRRHGVSSSAAILLGRGLTAGCLLTTLTKGDDERVRIAMKGDGPLGRMLVDARGQGTVRGCFTTERVSQMNLPAQPGRGAVGSYVGAGQLQITRDLGLENTYQGIVELTSGELDEDLEHYLTTSEQLPSVLRCQVSLDSDGQVLRAAGVLAQTFPGSDPSLLDPVRRAVADEGLADVLRQERSVEDLMGFALQGGEYHASESAPLSFACECGPERARAVVSTLGADDIDALATEQGSTDVRCSYCGDAYTLDEAALRALAQDLRTQRS